MSGHIHLDPIGGIAGDMFVAAMIDAFAHLEGDVMAGLAAVLPDGVAPQLVEKRSNGFAARHFSVVGQASEGLAADFPALEARILAAALPDEAKRVAGLILRRLGEAEAAVHGVGLDAVHFHEIGDWDSLADVVAAGVVVAAFPGWSWSVASLPLGGGVVRSRHGPIPVPAPATAMLLKGFAFHDDGVSGERVTPTGAAILAALAPGAHAGGVLSAVGMGAGTRDLDGVANVLRVSAFEPVAADTPAQSVVVVTFAVDDMTGEEVAVAADKLRGETGVLDLSLTSRVGKKGRPEVAFELLVAPDAFSAVAERCFAETATIGLRFRQEDRIALPRELGQAAHGVSEIRCKRVVRPGGVVTVKAESDDLAALDGLAARRAAKMAAEDGS